ncbi:ABC transporter ATP-binding protein [Rhodocyclaceae bacterium SMB388]
MLEVAGVALQVGERWLCCEFGMRLAAGECLALIGPNGAGKTTLLNTIAGLRAPSVGEIRIEGRPLAQWDSLELARCRGLLTQHQGDHFSSSVLQTVLIGRHPHLGRWGWEGEADERMAREALREVGLAGFEARNILTLSGGERQRVAIAALLTQSPRLFLLDEPNNHLDLRFQIAMLDLFRRRADAGCGVVMVLHDVNLAVRYADLVILLDGSGGVRAGSRDEVLREDWLSAAFGHRLLRHELGGRTVFLPA